MTQPSEFEQVVGTLQLAKWQSDILSIAHNASTRAALERLKRAKVWGQVPEQWRSGNVKGGIYRQGFNAADIAWAENVDRELAALSGQEPAKPTDTEKVALVNNLREHLTSNSSPMPDGVAEMVNKHFFELLADSEPAKPCKTCDGCGWVNENGNGKSRYQKPCVACGGSGIDPEHPHQSKMCKCIKPPCAACGGTGVAK